MAKWRRGHAGPRYFYNARTRITMRKEADGTLISDPYETGYVYADTPEGAAKAFLEGIEIVSVPNEKDFCTEVRRLYAEGAQAA